MNNEKDSLVSKESMVAKDSLVPKDSLVSRLQVMKAVEALKSYVTKVSEMSSKKSLLAIQDDDDVQLQFTFKKIPKMNRSNVRVVLKHPTIGPTTSVCLFVKDVDKSREYDKTVRKYTEMFSSSGVKRQIEFFPLKKLKLEFSDFEAKRNLSNTYDVFLSDARITRLLPARLGKHFIGRRKFPIQVHLDAKQLNAEITKSLHTTQCVITGKGASCQMRVGLISQSGEDLVENILQCVDKLATSIPGGCVNIRNLVIRTKESKAVPLYLSLGSKDEVKFPKQRRTRQLVEAEDVTTVFDARVRVNSYGHVKLLSKTKAGQENKGTDDKVKVAKQQRSKKLLKSEDDRSLAPAQKKMKSPYTSADKIKSVDKTKPADRLKSVGKTKAVDKVRSVETVKSVDGDNVTRKSAKRRRVLEV